MKMLTPSLCSNHLWSLRKYLEIFDCLSAREQKLISFNNLYNQMRLIYLPVYEPIFCKFYSYHLNFLVKM